MFNQLTRFSGLFAIATAWFFLIVPLIITKADSRTETVTTVAGKSRLLRLVITTGLMGGGAAMQALFIFYVCDKFILDRWNLGSVLYLTANLATVFVGLVYYEKYPRLHTFFTRYYFFTMPLALLLIGYMFGDAHRTIFITTVVLVIAYALGQFSLFRKYQTGNALMEGWGFVILTIWTLMMCAV